MKKTTILMLACAVLGPALALWAQELEGPQGPPPEGGPQPAGMAEPKEHPMISPRFSEMLEKRLQLTPRQKSDVQGAISGSKDGLNAKFNEMLKLHKEMSALEKELWTKIRASLTDEQKKTLDELQRMRPVAPGAAPRGGMRPAGRPGGK